MSYYQITDFYKYLKNPNKYKGTRPLTMRSGWEIQYAKWIDNHSSIIEWRSESDIIPYISPLDKKYHRYFIDFWMKMKENDGKITEYLIEVKPHAEVLMVENKIPPKRMTKAAIKRIQSAIKNEAKWKAAREFCAKERQSGKNIHFVIITEKDFPFK